MLFYILLVIVIVTNLNKSTAFSSLNIFRTHQWQINYCALRYQYKSPSLSAAPSDNIKVSQVESNADIISLADLRYEQWILEDQNEQKNASLLESNNPPHPPSRNSFRLATAEIYNERSAEGALVFMARYQENYNINNGDTNIVVGAAELSPIETRDCIYYNAINESQELKQTTPLAIYATDVVTSTSRRRLGIGSKLMMALEEYAWSLGRRFVLLHVEHDNIAAIDFYRKLGYVNVDHGASEEAIIPMKLINGLGLTTAAARDEPKTKPADNFPTITIKGKQLAINAGTLGQSLMVKQLFLQEYNGELDSIAPLAISALKVKAGAGFGSKVKAKKGRKK